MAAARPEGPPPITTTSNAAHLAKVTAFPDMSQDCISIVRRIRPDPGRGLHEHRFREVRISRARPTLDYPQFGEGSHHLVDLIHILTCEAAIPCRAAGE